MTAVQLDILDAAAEANRPQLRIGSLCTGYGGLTAAVQEVFGGTVAWHADNSPDASSLLAHRHPDVPNLGDLTAADWARVLAEHGPVDIVEGGYPCQPFSISGLKKGTADDRHLWPHIARAVGVLRPGLVVLENVANHLRLGFADVLADLARLGFDAEWACVRAADAGAAHLRDRLFVLARNTDRMARPAPRALGRRPGPLDQPGPVQRTLGPDRLPVPDPDRHGRQVVQRQQPRLGPRDHADGRSQGSGERVRWGAYGPAVRRWEHITARAAPAPAEPAPRGGRRLSPPFVEWLMGVEAGRVTAVPGLSHPAQLQLLGNGVVPQQAAHALRLLLDRAPEALAALPALDTARSTP